MDTYLYVGRNARGELMKGKIESTGPQAVASWLVASGISPVSIKPQPSLKAQPAWVRSLQGERALGDVDLLLFTKQLGIMMKAGVPVMQALAALQRSVEHPRMAELLQALREDLDKGQELSSAMARHKGFFSEYYLSMVKVGEGSGRLDEVLFLLTRQIEFDRQMRQKIKSAMRYPSFVLLAISAAVAALAIFVIPVFAGVYQGMKVELPPLTRALLTFSDFMVAYWWTMLLAGGLMYFAFRRYTADGEGRYRWDRFKLRAPVVGSIISKASIARFCVAFTIATRTGVPLIDTINLLVRVVDNAFYGDRILGMREGLQRGESLTRVSQASGIFKPLELQMFSIGEETGEMEAMFDQVAQMYQEEVDYAVDRISESIEPILLGFMGALVAVLMLGVFMPLWDLGQMAQQR